MSLGTTENIGAFAQLSPPAALDVLDFLDPQSLVMFSCTCRAAHALAALAKARNADWQRCVVDGDYQRANQLGNWGLACAKAPTASRSTIVKEVFAGACKNRNAALAERMCDCHWIKKHLGEGVVSIIRYGSLADIKWMIAHSRSESTRFRESALIVGCYWMRADVVQWSMMDWRDAASEAYIARFTRDLALKTGQSDLARWFADRYDFLADREIPVTDVAPDPYRERR